MTEIPDGLIKELNGLAKRLAHLDVQNIPRWIYLDTPLTSTSWDGDSFSTTAKTKIDLSVVFSAPAGIKAVLVRIFTQDSASASTQVWFGISPNSTAGDLAVVSRAGGLPNNYKNEIAGICACDVNGDIYYQVGASGASTMAVWIQIWGYQL